MGTSGTAIFSDDTACDVRGEFRDLIGDGYDAETATARMVEEWKPDEDPDDGTTFWLALAATQWSLGLLQPDVLARALGVINSGHDLSRWRLPGDIKKRERALDELRSKLIAPQPPAKRVPRRFRSANDWEVGSLHSYGLRDGQKCVFRVIGHHIDKGGTNPVVELLDWIGLAIPPESALTKLPIRIRVYPNGHSLKQFMLGAASARDVLGDRRRDLKVASTPSQRMGVYSVFLGRDLDRHLATIFGMAT